MRAAAGAERNTRPRAPLRPAEAPCLGVGVGHMTEDGVFSLMEVECLASCGSGPMMKVGEDYYEHLTAEAVDSLIDRFKKEAPSLEGRPYYCKNNKPHTGAVPGFESKLPVLNATPPPATNSAPK